VIVDLHGHYAMHLMPSPGAGLVKLALSQRARGRWRDRMRSQLVAVASRLWNHPTPTAGPAVTVPLMRAGGVGVLLSVLYSPLDEMDISKAYGSPPDSAYFARLMRQLELVEEDIAQRHPDEVSIARRVEDVDAALAASRTALVHCVEGAFHLGSTVEEIERNVAVLAARGVAYITVAHLFWRGVATNAPALPFLPDWAYRLLFPQPARGLSALGEAAVRAMVAHGVLIDVTHMSGRCLDETFELLAELDPDGRVPVAATHGAYRFGGLAYNLTDAQIEAVAEREGVVGILVCEHFVNDGLRRRRTRTFEQSVDLLCRHVDRLREVTGSHRHTGIGSDLDGFIKPTLRGLDDARKLGRLEAALVERYGSDDARAICSDNALRLLRRGWRAGHAAA
jgi:microsomal dipeptidase-like Zn-dependent dipeptidase